MKPFWARTREYIASFFFFFFFFIPFASCLYCTGFCLVLLNSNAWLWKITIGLGATVEGSIPFLSWHWNPSDVRVAELVIPSRNNGSNDLLMTARHEFACDFQSPRHYLKNKERKKLHKKTEDMNKKTNQKIIMIKSYADNYFCLG